MTEDISQIEPEKPHSNLNRREFLHKAVNVGIVGAAVSTGLISDTPSVHREKHLSPEGLPTDILTDEELVNAHIRIDSTDKVQLKLRRSILEDSLFKDAAEGKNEGVVVVLVDTDAFTWNSIENLKPDSKAVLRRGLKADMANQAQYDEQISINNIRYQTIHIDDLLSGKYEEEIKKEISKLKDSLPPKDKNEEKYNMQHAAGLEDELLRVKNGQALINAKEELESSQRDIESLHAMNIDDSDTIPDFLKNRKYAAGMYASPDEFPEATGKTYLFLAAGGKLTPHPNQSLPGPDDFTVTDQKSYHVWNKKNPYSTTLGWTAWHEKGHHGEGGKINDEWHADDSAISGITVAWEYYQKTGDNSKYPFVFITDEGVIITKKINQERKDPLIF